MQSVARFAGFSVADAIGEDDEILACIEQLSGAKELAGELGADELRPAARGAVQNQNRIARDSLRVAPRLTERAVMDAQFRQRRAGGEFEILEHDIVLGRCGIFRRHERGRHEQQERNDQTHGSPRGNLADRHSKGSDIVATL